MTIYKSIIFTAEEAVIVKRFNTTGPCIPSKHYRVDISKRIADTKAMIRLGHCLSIVGGRQSGKTTTIFALTRVISEKYCVISLDLQDFTSALFADENRFVKAFARILFDDICAPVLSGLPDGFRT